jgi:leucine efflux protein
MFAGITDLPTFLLGTIVIVLLPGPNSLYVMSIAARHGVAAGYRGACGIFLGDTLLMLLSVTGAASLLAATPALFMAIKYAGALYLAWMGIGLLKNAWRLACRPEAASATAPPAKSAAAPLPDGRRAFYTAFFISLTNPKAILFFVSFFIQFVAPDTPHPGLAFLILGLIVQACSALYLSALIFGGARLADFFRARRGLSAASTGAVGALFIGFGGKLAGSNLG